MLYGRHIQRVCDYIAQHLDEELTLDQLSRVASLSKFHFHRIFSSHTGISLFKFIKMERLKRASLKIAFKDDVRVIDIALDAGFESPEAFSRAFKKRFGQTPSEFRKAPEWPNWHSKLHPMPIPEITPMNVNIIHFEPQKVAILEHHGSPDRVYESSAKFIKWRKQTGLSPVKTSKTFGIPYDDPSTVAAEDFRFDICGSIDHEVPENPFGVKSGEIPGGRCAVLRHEGSHDHLSASVYALYKEWLPQSGEELRDFPCFFHYLNLIPDTNEGDLLTDIYLPLKGS